MEMELQLNRNLIDRDAKYICLNVRIARVQIDGVAAFVAT